MTTKTKSAAPTVAKSLTEWVKGFTQLTESQSAQIVKMTEAHEDAKAVYVFKMSEATSLSNAKIAEALGVQRDYVGKLIARGGAVSVGIDGATTARAIKATGNKVTVSAISEILESDGTKADKSEALEALGLKTKESARRDVEGGKPKASMKETTARDLALIAKIVERALDGKTAKVAIWEALVEATENEGFRL
jgi:hypothetical protein